LGYPAALALENKLMFANYVAIEVYNPITERYQERKGFLVAVDGYPVLVYRGGVGYVNTIDLAERVTKNKRYEGEAYMPDEFRETVVERVRTERRHTVAFNAFRTAKTETVYRALVAARGIAQGAEA